MSRIGKKPIEIPNGVTVTVADNVVTVKGPKGELSRIVHKLVTVKVEDNIITLNVPNQGDKKQNSLWGTFASHINNMIAGVTDGFKKQLEVNGVGYRVAKQGSDLKIEVGYSHPVLFPVPEGIQAEVEKNVITITGVDKELVGDVSAEIRAIRKPEPYKGKGIKYMEEVIRRKAGKAASKSA